MWTKMVDMEMDDEAILDAPMPIAMPERARFPYGLRICLTHAELAKLGLEANCDIGDMIDMRCMGEVTSITKDGDNCRVEIQIQRIALEDEDNEEMPGPKTGGNPLHDNSRS